MTATRFTIVLSTLLMAGVSAPALAAQAASAPATADQPPAEGAEKTAGNIESAGDIVVTARRTSS